MPKIYNPTTEAHYLTEDGDVLDLIGYRYYGREAGTTEALLARNPWLSFLPPVLTAGLILVLPVLDQKKITSSLVTGPVNEKGIPLRQLWKYRTPKVWKGVTAPAAVSEAAALADYQAAAVLIAEEPALPSTAIGCCEEIKNPLVFDEYEYIAIYYQDAAGDWKLGRMHKSNIGISESGGYGYSLGGTEDVLSGGLL